MELSEVLCKIQQGLKAPKGQRNTFGNYNYRSCEDILESVKPMLGKCVLVISDEVVMLGARFYVKATAKIILGKESHETYGWAREEEKVKGMKESQITGSTSSYARKYALNGLFCIDDTKDSDATNQHGKAIESKAIKEIPRPLYEVYEGLLVNYNDGELGVLCDSLDFLLLKEEIVVIWKLFSSKQRAAIKKHKESESYAPRKDHKDTSGILTNKEHADYFGE